MFDPLLTSISGFTAAADVAAGAASVAASVAASGFAASASATGCHHDDGCCGEHGESDDE